MLDKFLLLFARFVEATERQAKATEGMVLLEMARAGINPGSAETGETANLDNGAALTEMNEQQKINDEIAAKTAAAADQKKADEAAAAKKTADAKKAAEAEKAKKAKAESDAKAKAEAEAKAKAEADLAADLAGGDDDGPRKVSVDDVRSALRDYSKLEGTDAAIALLARFKAASVSDLSADDRVKMVDVIAGKDVEE